MRRRSSKRLYFDAGEFRYWAMDPSLASTDLINRQLIAISECKPIKLPPPPVPQMELEL